jgi:S-DNA-T family DNA segregation ATPase FtsK/SpoIIIE
MDEFQVLFGDIRQEDAISRDSGQILEDLVKRGRGFGIHVLLSSQSPSAAGSYGNSIYKQMGLRIALRCLAQDAQAILGEGNSTADRLERPGEAIYNDEMSQREELNHTRRVVAACRATEVSPSNPNFVSSETIYSADNL